jgi:hypothetical protein
MRSDATTPASSTPPTAASSRATPNGMFLLTVEKDTFTDLVFWMMNASKSNQHHNADDYAYPRS